MIQIFPTASHDAAILGEIASRHPWVTLIGLSALAYLLKTDFLRLRRRLAVPALAASRAIVSFCRHKAEYHFSKAGDRWNEINLYSMRDAPSRLFFGLLGASMLWIMFKSSYANLVPPAEIMAALSNSSVNVNSNQDWWISTEVQIGMLIAFEAFIGFVCLEFFDVTSLLKFRHRYRQEVNKRAGRFLLFFLIGLGAFEASLTWAGDAIDREKECAKVSSEISKTFKDYDDICQPSLITLYTSIFSDGSGMPTSADDPNSGQDSTYGLEAAKAINDHERFALPLALTMPFVLMIVGLAFDFFEELHLPGSSLVASSVYAVSFLAAFVVATTILVMVLLTTAIVRLLGFPAALVVYGFYTILHRFWP